MFNLLIANMRLNDGKILELKLKKLPEKDGILLVAENYDRNIKPSIKFFNQITVIHYRKCQREEKKAKTEPESDKLQIESHSACRK